ncbi:MAG: ABC transporter substrate-binding protein, partial [Archaeoglobaceae archaeon]
MRWAVLVALALLIALCATPEQQHATSGQKRDKVVIGVLAPMSLPEGTAQEKAVKLAVEEINAKGGILGYKVEVVVGDDKLDPSVG